MIISDHQAVRKAYPEVITIDGSKALKQDGTEVTLVQSDIDAARVTLDAETLANKYKTDRTRDGSTIYDTITNQLDQLYHDMKDGKLGVAATTGSWFVGISSVKTAIAKT